MERKPARGSFGALRVDPGDEIAQDGTTIVMPGEGGKLHMSGGAKAGNGEAKKVLPGTQGDLSRHAHGRELSRHRREGRGEARFGNLAQVNDAMQRRWLK